MRRPVDPRHHGLHHPKKLLSKEYNVVLNKFQSESGKTENKYLLGNIADQWEEIKINASYDGKTVMSGPFLDQDYYSLRLTYTLMWDNLEYAEQLELYNTSVKEYENKVIEYDAKLKRKEEGFKEKLDVQIIRLEHKLANLKANRNGEVIPFPED